MELLFSSVLLFFACAAFGFLCRLRPPRLFLAAVGSVLGWISFSLFQNWFGEIFSVFLASLIISIYSEILARIQHAPATVYLTVSLLPLVPGRKMFHAMQECLNGNTNQFLNAVLYAFAIAGVLALGILLVSSTVRIATGYHKNIKKRKKTREKP